MAGTTPIGNIAVAHFADGRLLKGRTNDFHPDKPHFHILETDAAGQAHGAPQRVLLADLKGVFFVRTVDGDPEFTPSLDLTAAIGQGRKIEVAFSDGERLAGFTVNYNRDKPGFFLFPTDPKDNNQRIYVVASAVASVRFL